MPAWWWRNNAVFAATPDDDGTIFIGNDLERLNKKLSETDKKLIPVRLHKYESFEKFIIETSEFSLTHEILHIIIGELIGDAESRSLDNIDWEHEISQYHTLRGSLNNA